MALHRIFALIVRNIYLLRRSPARLIDLFWWQMISMALWGILTLYLNRVAQADVNFTTLLLGALIFWEIISRAQLSIGFSFLEEVWTTNLINLFAAPLTLVEFTIALVTVSVLRALIAFTVMAVFGFLLVAFNVFDFGILLVPYALLLLVFAWALGIFTTGIIVRFGNAAEFLAWSLVAVLQPFSAVFYPVSALPSFLQPIALLLPSTHVFEGMRQTLLGGAVDPSRLLIAAGLDLVFLAVAFAFFAWMFRLARREGLLVRLVTE